MMASLYKSRKET